MTADNQIAAYTRRLSIALARVPSADRTAIVDETRAHLIDRAACGSAELDDAIHAFGPPERYAEAFLDEYRQAGLAAGSIRAIGAAAVRLAVKGVGGFIGAAIVLLIYFMALSLPILAVLEFFIPRQVGLFVGDEVFGLGVVDVQTADHAQEFLGPLFTPLAIAASLALYLFGTWLLKRLFGVFVTNNMSIPNSRA